MNIIYNPTAPISNVGAVVAFGAFDGLHKGHMALMEKLQEIENLNRIVFTFRDNPSKIAHNIDVKYIISQEYKKILLEQLQLDYLVIQDFTKDFMHIEAERFFYDYIIGILGAKAIIVGYNFAFGKKNRGDIPLLERLCEQNGIALYVMPPVKVEEVAVSSTLIRKLILAGELEAIKKMLGRPFTIYGRVILGKQLGTVLGFPTANIQVDDGQALPPDGVYATSVEIDGKRYLGVSNLGGRPTVEKGYRALETNVMGYEGNLYDKDLAVYFHKKIRGIKKFDSIEQLKTQIAQDCMMAEENFRNKLFTI